MTKKYKVILVEDEKNFVEAIVKASANYDEFEIVTVTDLVNVALELINAERHEIIITDIQLPDDSGLNLVRQVKNDDKFLKYSPYIIGITSYSSQSTIQQLKDLVDFIHIKNSFFNADRIFIELRYALQSINSNLILKPSILSAEENMIEQTILKVLNRFNTNPKLKRHRKCAVNIILLAIQFDDYSLKNLYSKVAPIINLKNSSGVNSLLSRYLDEVKDADIEVLEHIFKTCEDSRNPTAKEFIFIIAEKVKGILEL